jgi:trigger factor
MQVTETLSEDLKREFKVVVAAKDISEKLEVRLEELGQQVRIPGFRPGKVPLTILKQRFGTSVMGEIVEQAVNDASSQAMDERGLRPAMQPKIEITSFDEGKDLEYTMALELLPEIEPMDFAELELERLAVDVQDDETQEALGRLASNQMQTEALEEPRKSLSGDVLVIDFKGTVDGEAFPGMSGEDHHLELGANRFVEGFEDQLVGVDAGQELDVKVTFPDAYVNDKLAGKDAVFQVKVKDILQAKPHPIDDELAQSLGEEDLDSLKEKVKEQIAGEYSSAARARLKRALLDKLAEAHGFGVPMGMVDLEFDAIWGQIEKEREEGRVDPDDKGKSDEELKAEYREIAERRVRLGLLLSEVGRSNGIEVTDDEVNQALVREAQRHPGHEREVFEFYQKSPEGLANLRAPLFEDKVVDFIIQLAKVEERKVTADELRASVMEESGLDADSKSEADESDKSEGDK